MPTGAFITAKCNKGFNITHFDELLKKIDSAVSIKSWI